MTYIPAPPNTPPGFTAKDALQALRNPALRGYLVDKSVPWNAVDLEMGSTLPAHPRDRTEFNLLVGSTVVRMIYRTATAKWYPISGGAPAITHSMNLQGPWPVNTAVIPIVYGGTVEVILHGATAFNTAGGVLCGIPIEWDSVTAMTSKLFINPANTHMTFPGVAATFTDVDTTVQHFATVESPTGASSTSDSNDFASLTIRDWPGTA